MNKRDNSILEWVRENRPDVLGRVEALMESDGPHFLLAIGFEAGRKFQHVTNGNPGDAREYILHEGDN